MLGFSRIANSKADNLLRPGRRIRERLFELFVAFNGLLAIVILLGIFLLLAREGLQLFTHYSIVNFLTGTEWYPVSSPPTFSLPPHLLATLWVTATAILIAVPIGVAAAAYLAEVAPPAVREVVKPLIELLAGVPSVVFGFVGLLVLSPIIRGLLNLNTGLCGLTAGIVLAFMSLPTIISISEDALAAVPREYREASYALGVSKWQTIVHVMIPAAISGITAAGMLGIGRSIGETMAALMVAGGRVSIPTFITDPMRPMTATIAAEINNAVQGGSQWQALFAIGLVLFVITFFVNLLADLVMEQQKRRFGT